MSDIDVVQFNEEQIRNIYKNDSQEADRVKVLLKRVVVHNDSAIKDFQAFLSDLNQQISSLLTIAGLFTLLPLDNIEYFLKWVFPFMFLSIFCLLMSFFRAKVHVPNMNFYPEETENGLVTLLYEAKVSREKWNIYERGFARSVKFYRFARIFIEAYFISFVMNYYFIKFGSFDTFECFHVISVLIAMIFISIRLTYSKKTEIKILK